MPLRRRLLVISPVDAELKSLGQNRILECPYTKGVVSLNLVFGGPVCEKAGCCGEV